MSGWRARACAIALLLACGAAQAQAQTRAWLDRDRIALGETATLNIETTRPGADAPDYTALARDFEVSGHSSRRSTELVNGRQQARALFAVALRPRREGALTVPPLQVAGDSTRPLVLTVVAARAAPARAGQPAFIESTLDAPTAYVQQAVGYVLRLYYATPLVSGQLDQPAPDGASMSRVGSDVQYTRDVGGQRYSVVERRYRIIPERSGPLTIPGAVFEGRGVGGMFDDFFGGGSRRELRANGAPSVLQVQPMPDGAPQPWLPLQALALRYVSTPQTLRAGEAAHVVVEMTADGAIASQLPPLELAQVAGIQVFADPPQVDEAVDDGRLRVRVTRRFSLLPSRAGAFQIPGPRQAWWDARGGTARTASLPDLRLQVEPGSAVAEPAPHDAAAPPADAAPNGWPWPWIAAFFALMWLGTLAWVVFSAGAARIRPGRSGGVPAVEPARHPPRPALNTLMRALKTEALGDVATLLCAMATPPAADLDALSARLADPAQREAVALLQRARWADGSADAAATARAALRDAFRGGPQWRTAAAGPPASLPPLYPGRSAH